MLVKFLTLSALLAIPLELYSSNFHLTLYYNDILGTMPALKQFASLAVLQALVRY
jgi:hypothetical protein